MKRLLMPLLGVVSLALASSVMAGKSADATSAIELNTSVGGKSKPVYIVKLRQKSLLEYEGGISGIGATKPVRGEKINSQNEDVIKYSAKINSLHEQILDSVGADVSEKIYSYRFATNGFAAKLTASQVEQLKNNSNVLVVFKDELMQLQTDTSPNFLGLTERGQAWARGWTGENVVVGVLDSGINPEHPSFADVETPRRGARGRMVEYGPIPDSFTGAGCAFGNTAFNAADAPFDCNNKLIKADYFVDGFGADSLVPTEFLSARDSDGHGSHTAGTAAGNFGVAAHINDEFQGNISGIAPRARVAVYKVCWEGTSNGGCARSDSMAAIDQAVADGVDVINFSIGGSSTQFGGPDDIAFLLAADAGVFVATSQGNSGPDPDTTGTPAGVPWITAVGAAQDDQVFATGVDVAAPASISGEYLALEGGGVVTLEDTGDIATEIVPSLPANGCTTLTNPGEVSGKIALVIRGACSFLTKYQSAQAAGARAIVVYNDGSAPNRMNPISMGGFDGSETIPGVMVGFMAGDTMAREFAGGASVTGTMGPSIMIPQVNRIAGFSSRGPNGGAPDIIKPDVAAPGVRILAAGSSQPNEAAVSAPFVNLNGTSMSSPHVAGLFALLKQAHPDWTPAMARSAVMTTARNDMKKSFGEEAADPFDIGAGHIVPNKAFRPGLVYDVGLPGYLAFSCENNVALVDWQTCAALEAQGYAKEASNLNLPSIAVSRLTGLQVVRRTVTSVTRGRRKFEVSYDAPEGIEMVVWPTTLRLREGESADYFVAFIVTEDAVMDEWTFGSLEWKFNRGRRSVRSPIALKPVEMNAPDMLTGKSTEGQESFNVSFGYDGDFNVTADGLAEGIVSANEIEDGAVNQNDAFIIPEGTTYARFSMFDAEVGDGSGADDLDIQVYGPDTAGFPLAGTSQGGSSEETIELTNPAPGLYIVVVFDFATAAGPTVYTVYNFNLDGRNKGNMAVSAPATASTGTQGTVDVSWSGLLPAARYLGILRYDNGRDTFEQTTELTINTQ